MWKVTCNHIVSDLKPWLILSRKLFLLTVYKVVHVSRSIMMTTLLLTQMLAVFCSGDVCAKTSASDLFALHFFRRGLSMVYWRIPGDWSRSIVFWLLFTTLRSDLWQFWADKIICASRRMNLPWLFLVTGVYLSAYNTNSRLLEIDLNKGDIVDQVNHGSLSVQACYTDYLHYVDDFATYRYGDTKLSDRFTNFENRG